MIRFRAVLLALLAALCCVWTANAADRPAPVLRLKRGTVDPRTLTEHTPANAVSTVRVLQFRAVPGASVREDLERAGIAVLEYLPDQALVVRARTTASLAAIRERADLAWDGPVAAAWKIAPDLGSRPFVDASRRAGGSLLAIVTLWPDADTATAVLRVLRSGAEVRAQWEGGSHPRLLVRAPERTLRALAADDDVAFIEEAPEATPRNDEATWVVQSGVLDVRPLWDRGLYGQGQIIGNIDGQLDMNSCYFDDAGTAPGPGHRKVIAYRSNNGLGADSHGTHTNGTMAGDSGSPGVPDPGDGHALAAKIVFANLSDINGSGSAPSNLLDYLVLAHQDGARVHTNSWGDDGTTAYTSWSRDIDEFSWNYEDSLVLFAVTNGSSLKTPENAKNVLAVGATEREGNAGNHCSGGRGPTSDGRRKPEIYAPGCSTVSAASGQTCGTRSLTGTSMASPAVAGAAALVRQYLVDGWYPTGSPDAQDSLVPTGALLKAVLVSGAVDMTGVLGYPSDLEGWGRVQLDRSLFFAGDDRGLVILDDVRRAQGLRTNDERTYTIDVVDGAQDLRVTLAFTEPPAALLAANATVNDLDLFVTAPDGTEYWGNRTDGNGASIPGGSPDAKNNLEQVLIASPQVGAWTVTVIARSVPIDAQGFALVSTGGVSAVAAGVRLRYDGHRIVEVPARSNGNASADPGETVTLPVTLRNRGDEGATGVDAGLRVDRADWARVVVRKAAWMDLEPNASAESLLPQHELVISPEAPCGERLTLFISPSSDQGDQDPASFAIDIGRSDRDYPQNQSLGIPAFALGFVESSRAVEDDVSVRGIEASVEIEHQNIGELRVVLLSPEGTQVVLHDRTRAGESGLDLRYGADRDADGPGSLDDFVGENAQGTWRLVISDNQNSAVPAGRLVRWVLHVTADRALECSPISCSGAPASAVPPALLVTKSGANDLAFSWPALAGAFGYHVLEAAGPAFADPELLARTSGATESTASGAGGGEPGTLTFFQVRAVNECSWEGP